MIILRINIKIVLIILLEVVFHGQEIDINVTTALFSIISLIIFLKKGERVMFFLERFSAEMTIIYF
jgi:hypothetical protein